MDLHDFAGIVSLILGWSSQVQSQLPLDPRTNAASSFILWSVSFYPQPFLNHKRRSTQGLSIDFPTANVLGLSSYAIYTGSLLLSPLVRREYAARHPKTPLPSVRANDFFYGLHGALLTALTYSQFFPRLWGFRGGVGQRASRLMLGLLLGGICSVGAVVVIVASHSSHSDVDPLEWGWIDVVYALSDFKLFTTVIKYTPQAYLNYKRKATTGWSIWGVLLDFTGGVASLLQLFVDGAFDDDWGSVTGNPAKFILGNITLFFDVIFMLQHYVLYSSVERKDVLDRDGVRQQSEEDPLLEPDRR
ncbi:MAG: hypothetical protein M1828_001954 [Chrysothrix sp. TS-e1954]|nr:MAG: hypothetical protein M1828_001954 [Chrysothrix sp. TS-e1954]